MPSSSPGLRRRGGGRGRGEEGLGVAGIESGAGDQVVERFADIGDGEAPGPPMIGAISPLATWATAFLPAAADPKIGWRNIVLTTSED